MRGCQQRGLKYIGTRSALLPTLGLISGGRPSLDYGDMPMACKIFPIEKQLLTSRRGVVEGGTMVASTISSTTADTSDTEASTGRAAGGAARAATLPVSTSMMTGGTSDLGVSDGEC